MNPKRLETKLAIADDLRRKDAVKVLMRAVDAVEELLNIPHLGSTMAVDSFLGFLVDSLIRLSYLLLSGKLETQQVCREVLICRACSVNAFDPETHVAVQKAAKNKCGTADRVAAVKSLCTRLEQLLDSPQWKPGRDLTEAQRFYTAIKWDRDPKKRRPRPKKLIAVPAHPR